MAILFEKISLLILFAISIIILIAALPVHFEGFDGIAEKALRDIGADSVTVGNLSVSPFGVRVRNVNVYKRINDDKDYRVRISLANVRCNVLSAGAMFLFSRDRLIPDRDIFRDAYEKPLELAGDVSELAASIRTVKQITVRGADVHFSEKGKTWVSVNGASARVVNGKSALGGKVSITSAFVPSLAEIENFSVKLSLDRDRLGLTGGKGTVFGGKITADLSLDLNSERVIDGRAVVSGLDLEAFCRGTNFETGTLGGKVDVSVTAGPGSPASLDSVRASGAFTVTGLTAAEIALQRTAAVNQLSRELRTLFFREASGKFNLVGDRVNFDEITGAGEVLKFRSTGWMDFSGRLKHDLEGELSPQFVAGLPKVIRNSLEQTEDGGGKFKCRVTGTFHRPRVEVDRSVYNRAVRNLFRSGNSQKN